jgi:opacity protein-like surface antigen
MVISPYHTTAHLLVQKIIMKILLLILSCAILPAMAKAEWKAGIDYVLFKDEAFLFNNFSSNVVTFNLGYQHTFESALYISTTISILLHSNSERGVFSSFGRLANVDEIELQQYLTQDIRLGYDFKNSVSVYSGLVYSKLDIEFIDNEEVIGVNRDKAVGYLLGLDWQVFDHFYVDTSYSKVGDIGSALKLGINYRF